MKDNKNEIKELEKEKEELKRYLKENEDKKGNRSIKDEIEIIDSKIDNLDGNEKDVVFNNEDIKNNYKKIDEVKDDDDEKEVIDEISNLSKLLRDYDKKKISKGNNKGNKMKNDIMLLKKNDVIRKGVLMNYYKLSSVRCNNLLREMVEKGYLRVNKDEREYRYYRI